MASFASSPRFPDKKTYCEPHTYNLPTKFDQRSCSFGFGRRYSFESPKCNIIAKSLNPYS